MLHYRLTFFDFQGRPRGVKEFYSSEDVAAMQRAQNETCGAPFELRSGNRIVVGGPGRQIDSEPT